MRGYRIYAAFGLALATAASIVCFSTVHVQAQIPSDVLAHWKLDETAATQTAADSSPNANDGLRMNGAAPAPGRIGGAVFFDGVDDHIVVTSPNWKTPRTRSRHGLSSRQRT